MNAKQPLADQFYDIVETWIDDEGVYPHQMLTRDASGSIALHALDVPPLQVYHYALLKSLEGHEVIFGLDRTTRAGQGTTLGNVLTCVHIRQDQPPRVGVIEYEPEPRQVLPWNWDNPFWEAQIKREMSQVLARAQAARQGVTP